MKPFKFPRIPGADLAANFLNSRSVREKQLIFGFVIALGLGADLALFVQPVAGILFEFAPKLPPLRQELRELKQDTKSKDAIKKEWEDSRLALQQQQTSFISVDGAPALLEDLSKEAQRSGVKLTALKPSENAEGGKSLYSRLPIEIKAMAGAHELGQFLSNLETGKTFFRVKDLRVTMNPQNERKHLVQLSLETYKKD